MFIQKMTFENMEKLAMKLEAMCRQKKDEVWTTTITNEPDSRNFKIFIQSKDCNEDVSLRLYDYTIDVWSKGLLNRQEIEDAYMKFMYETFGEEYEREYKRHVRHKVF